MTPKPSPTRAARRLNAHHARTSAGFYPGGGLHRSFGARVRGGVLQITSDFETWTAIDVDRHITDHVGREVYL